MSEKRIDKLPKWARQHIADLSRQLSEERPVSADLETPERDVPPPASGSSFGSLTRGWDFNEYRAFNGMRYNAIPSDAVYKACSSSIHHGEGWDSTSSQGARHLYSTERKAWLALRSRIAERFNHMLSKVDEKIEVLGKDVPHPENPEPRKP